jgi:tight adherence protein B
LNLLLLGTGGAFVLGFGLCLGLVLLFGDGERAVRKRLEEIRIWHGQGKGGHSSPGEEKGTRAALRERFRLRFLRIKPRLSSRFRSRKRKKFELLLPDALSTMSGALRAGVGLALALEEVASRFPEPLAGEFRQAVRELNLGLPIEETLARMEARLGSPALRLLSAAVAVQRETGGNLAEILELIREVITDQQKLAQEIKTLTAQGRLSGWVIGCLPLFLFALFQFLNPEYTSLLFTHPLGRVMLATGVLLEILGMAVIMRMVKPPSWAG